MSWPFSKREIDPAERARAIQVYRRLFTQPKKLATLRAEFDAAVHDGSQNGTSPELLHMLQSHALKITELMSKHWASVLNETEEWPSMRTRSGAEVTKHLTGLFVVYLEKTLRWLDYFVLDPSWLNYTAVNYAANAARETASEVREVRRSFETEFELTRDDLAASKPQQHPGPGNRPSAA